MNQELKQQFIDWLRAGHTPATVSSYDYALRWFFRFVDTKDVLKLDLADFSRYLIFIENKGFKGGTRNHYATAVRAFWRWLRRQGLVTLDENLIPLPSKDDVVSYPCLNVDSFEKILGTFNEAIPIDLRNKTICRLFFLTGLRNGELRSIELHNVKEQKIYVKTFKRKAHYRYVYFDAECRRLLDKWLEVRKAILDKAGTSSPYLFISLSTNSLGGGLAKHAVIRLFTKAREELNLKERISAHSFRHGHATFAAERGMDIWKLKDSLGHASIRSTQIYVHTHEKGVEEEHGRIFGDL